MFRLFAFLFVVLIACAPVCYAQDARTLDEKLASEREAKRLKETELKALEGELTQTSERLVDVAAKVQSGEKSLAAVTARIEEIEAERDTLLQGLDERKISLSRLAVALERMRRMPPEAMIANPDKPLKTAQSAMLLREILPSLNKQAEQLRADIERLDVLSKDLQEQKSKAEKENVALAGQQDELNKLIGERKALYEATSEDIKAQERKIAHISAQSRTLTDLVFKLREQKEADKREAERLAVLEQSKAAGVKKKERKKVDSLPRAGSGRLPVSGVVVTAFEEPDRFGAPLQGIEIEAREGAVIVAPMGGQVRFAGHFKNYGNMVILEHEKGWHSLIAGLEKIDTVVGQNVGAGEPLGVLRKGGSEGKPRVYFELRENGKAVNPSRKFGELS